jgi:hypothetical protein
MPPCVKMRVMETVVRIIKLSSTPGINSRGLLALFVMACLVACGTHPQSADPLSDAPEGPRGQAGSFKDAASFAEALTVWQTPEDINAWIGRKFTYDTARAAALSETQRGRSAPLPIYEPSAFFESPTGVCVDLSRFAVETLRAIDRAEQPSYLMIEFAPVDLDGNLLRLHWLAFFRRDGNYYFFADSKRPGHLAGPYSGIPEFVAEYSKYRGRAIVAYRALESYQRLQRTPALKRAGEGHP